MLRSQSCFTDSFIQEDCSESLISLSRLSYLRFKHSSITILDANQHTLGSIAISGNSTFISTRDGVYDDRESKQSAVI